MMPFKYRIRNKLDKKEELRKFYKKKGYTKCKKCGRKLTHPDSMLRQMGLTCYKKTNQVKQLNFIEKTT